MLALARVLMFVERGAIEIAEAVNVLGEMRGHPIEQHADPMTVAFVDEELEFVRRAVARGGREVAGHLIAP